MTATEPQQPTGRRWHEWTRSDRLRAAREDLPGSPDQGEFAEISGISRNTINRYENKHYKSHRKAMVAAWAFATGFDVNWLWDGTIPGEDPDGEGWAPSDSNRQPADYSCEVLHLFPLDPAA